MVFYFYTPNLASINAKTNNILAAVIAIHI